MQVLKVVATKIEFQKLKTFKFFILLVLSISISTSYAQIDSVFINDANIWGQKISVRYLKSGVKKLASKKMLGRETSSKGELAAIKYITKKLKSYKLEPLGLNYIQSFYTGFSSKKKNDYYSYSDSAFNIIGFIKGSVKPDEAIIISGHYDHLGKTSKGIYFGADDNGSGISSILEIVRIFKLAESKGFKPYRSIIFLFFSGEEKGLLGSKHYVENPLWPLNKTIANINIDMIGRSDSAHLNDNKYIYVIGSDKINPKLHNVVNEVNQSSLSLNLDFKYNDPSDPLRLYYRSDHYNFAKKGIPVVFYFSGLHSDYHTPNDVYKRIEFDNLLIRVKLIFNTAWYLSYNPLNGFNND